jgi:hypothetical protein
MRAARWSVITLLLAALATLPARDVSAQARTVGYASLTPQVAQPVGPLAGYVDTGWGLNGSVLWPLPHVPWLGLRADLGFVRYGDASRPVCVFSNTLPVPSGAPPCAVATHLVTSSTIMHAGVGPQVTVTLGPVRPYVNGAVQLRYYRGSSSLLRTDGGTAFSEAFGQADAAWSAGYGAIFALPIRGAHVNVDLGVQRYHDGSVRYLRGGDVVPLLPYGLPLPSNWEPPPGAIDVGGGAYVSLNSPQRSPMDLVVYHIGVRMSVP